MEISLCITFLLLLFLTESTPAHVHSHVSKERIEDGVYSPIDRNHIQDGVHHSEFDHEAILGSTKEAEEFDQLPPEEAKRRLQILLTKMDLNNDKVIERNELLAWILRSFKMLAEEEANTRFEEGDENADGFLTWEEHLIDTYGSADADEKAMLDLYDDMMMKNDKAMFKAADKNHDDKLSKEEHLHFNQPEDYPEMFPLILQNTLDEKDMNKDGAIDFQEFIGEKGIYFSIFFGRQKNDKEWLIVEKEKFDSEYDKDKDGKLNSDEIISWVVPSNHEIAEEEVNHLFAAADEDNDGALSFNEILANYDTFVGSEATDYGEHLNNIHAFEDEL
ncbi:unnamed protein product [Bemisia tabaci]|uniref:Reticulocalbin-3 n=1 Tax=Bemisia tabaci TaxID=7038 RepID=A0A9P0A264_BEMTA|nr:unnamed protein product [Bemisia tabaci]